jgi:hypothetical protein
MLLSRTKVKATEVVFTGIYIPGKVQSGGAYLDNIAERSDYWNYDI